MGKFEIPGVTKNRFASIQDGEEWSRQIQESDWFKSRWFINKIEIVLWIRMTLSVLEKQIRASKITNLFTNDGDLKNDAIETGSFKDHIMATGTDAIRHRTEMKEAHFEYQKDVIKEHADATIGLSGLFFAMKKSVKYSYLIINGLILAFVIGLLNYNHQRSQLHAELHSTANADIAHAWYEKGQKTYESVLDGCKEGMLMQFTGEMSNDYRFEMTVCVSNGSASGAYIYNNLSVINKNLPNKPDTYDEPEYEDLYSQHTCAALMLKGKVKGDISTPGEKVSIDLTEYDSNNRKIGSFKGSGTVDNINSLYIEGVFKNRDGQKNKFRMQLSKCVQVESFSKIVDGMLERKSIRKVLYISDKDNPYAIVVTKDKEIRTLKYVDAFTDYDNVVRHSTPYYGGYDEKNVFVTKDCIIMRTPSEWITYSDGINSNIHAEKIRIIDLRGDSPSDTYVDGVVWNDAKWESDKMFYAFDSFDYAPIAITRYNQYGEKLFGTELPVSHVSIPSPGIIKGQVLGEDIAGNTILLEGTFDFDGNELGESVGQENVSDPE